jgi:hypothetical protein
VGVGATTGVGTGVGAGRTTGVGVTGAGDAGPAGATALPHAATRASASVAAMTGANREGN